MDNENMQAESVETAADTEVTTEDMLSAFDDGWDSDGSPTGTEDAEVEAGDANGDEAEANQQQADDADASTTEEPAAEAESAEQAAANQPKLKLKHYSGDREVGLEEATTLAQKGIDYDIKVPKLNAKIADYEAFLKEIAGNSNMSIEDVIDSTRARLYQANEKQNGRDISDTDALLKIQADRRNKAIADAEQQETEAKQKREAADKKINESLNKFMQLYPNVKAADIPQDVWLKAEQLGDLSTAYTMHKNAELERELTALKTNQKNANRSTGSQRNTGAATNFSAFDEGWDSID